MGAGSTPTPYPTSRSGTAGCTTPISNTSTGEEFFQHALAHERSGMSHWRKRIGDRLDILLAESLRIAHDTGALKTRDLARVTIDTTVQPKNVAFPTDAKLLETAIRQLGKLAKKHDVPLRQSYGLWQNGRR